MKNVRSTKHDFNMWRHWTPNSIPDSGHFWNQNIDVWTWITVFSLAVIKKPTAPWDSAHQEVLSGVIKTELNFSLHRHFNILVKSLKNINRKSKSTSQRKIV